MTIQPLNDRIVVSVIENPTKLPGGIFLPDRAKGKPRRGKVVAVGPGKLLDSGERSPINLQEGDEVVFGEWAGNDIKIDELEFRVLNENEIVGRVIQEV